MVPMRDSVRLATDIYRPARNGKPIDGQWPVILWRNPYGTPNNDATGEFFARHGYVYLAQDVRGAFDSEGTFTLFLQEGPDGHDAVVWASKQPWSNRQGGDLGRLLQRSDPDDARHREPPGTRHTVHPGNAHQCVQNWVVRRGRVPHATGRLGGVDGGHVPCRPAGRLTACPRAQLRGVSRLLDRARPLRSLLAADRTEYRRALAALCRRAGVLAWGLVRHLHRADSPTVSGDEATEKEPPEAHHGPLGACGGEPRHPDGRRRRIHGRRSGRIQLLGASLVRSDG